MGWWQREQQQNAQRAAEEQKKAAEQAKKDQQAAARNQLTDSWKDLYNSGGDAAVSQSILNSDDVKYYEKNQKWQEGSSYNQQDYNAAKKVQEGGTFRLAADEAYQATWEWYNLITGNGSNTTKYGPDAQSIYQIMPFSDFTKDHQSYDWSDGSYDERIKAEKAAADKAAADKAAADKAAADEAARLAEAKRQADLAEAQRQKEAAAQAALQKKPAPTPQAPVKEESPIEEAKGRTEEYKKTTVSNGNTITNNIEQNIGNRGDTTTNVGENNTINNSEIGNNKSENKGEINVTNEQQAWNNDDFVWSLAKEKADAYRQNANDRVKNGNTVNNSVTTFNNNLFQNTGNKGNWSTNVGNNNKLNNVKAGNDYSINLGNISSSNYSM